MAKRSRTVNPYAAKTHQSELVEPLSRPVKDRKPGAWKRRVEIGADFDAPLPADVLAAFEGLRGADSGRR